MVKISLAAARKNVNLSREKVAEIMGVAMSTLQNWENGTTFPKVNQAYKLSELYNVPLDCIDFEKNFAE